MKEPVTRDDLKKAESRLYDLKLRYLEEHGWKFTGKTPGAIMLYKKIHLEDTYLCNMAMALCVEEALSPE